MGFFKKVKKKVKKAVKKVKKVSLKATTAVSKISDKAGKVVATVGKYVPPPAGDKIALVGEGIRGFSDQLDYVAAVVDGFKTPSVAEEIIEDDYVYVEDSNNALKSSVVSSNKPGSPQVRSSSPVVQSSNKGIIEWILDLFF